MDSTSPEIIKGERVLEQFFYGNIDFTTAGGIEAIVEILLSVIGTEKNIMESLEMRMAS